MIASTEVWNYVMQVVLRVIPKPTGPQVRESRTVEPKEQDSGSDRSGKHSD
jgi:hypothetical protein